MDSYTIRASDITKIQNITTDLKDKIIIQGQVMKIRKSKNVIFIELQDGTNNDSMIQCVVPKTLCPVFDSVNRLAFILISGTVKELPPHYKSYKPFEFHILSLLEHGPSNSNYDSLAPIGNSLSNNANLHNLYLRHRHKELLILLTDLVLKTATQTAYTFDMVKITPPQFCSVKCEGGSELYELDHFGKTAYLTQSSQMYLESVVPAVKCGTFCDVPSFRKEKSRTKRHLNQFVHWECEMPGFYNFKMFTDFLEEFIKRFFDILLTTDIKGIIDSLGRREFIEGMIKKDITYLKHIDAINMLRDRDIKNKSGFIFKDFDDIPEAQERQLIDEIGTITFLTHFPTMTKAFYTKTDPTDKDHVLAVDIEFPFVGEIIGSSLRECKRSELERKLQLFTLRDLCDELTNLDVEGKFNTSNLLPLILNQDTHTLLQMMASIISGMRESFANESEELQVINKVTTLNKIEESMGNMPYSDYEWYFQLRDYGPMFTGGFGLGIERLVTWISGGEVIDGQHNYSIHSVTTFPRTVDKCYP